MRCVRDESCCVNRVPRMDVKTSTKGFNGPLLSGRRDRCGLRTRLPRRPFNLFEHDPTDTVVIWELQYVVEPDVLVQVGMRELSRIIE